MKLVVLGDFDDVAGFGLAGVEGAVVSGSSLGPTLSRCAARGDVALILVSASVARDAPEIVERAFDRREPPFLLVLPEPAAATEGTEGTEAKRRNGGSGEVTGRREVRT
jgi:vacuolar-type H+-ATPase subunit F/Vma7